MNTFDKPSLRLLRERLETVLKPLEQELGIGITLGRCTFTSSSATMKLELVTAGTNGKVERKEVTSYKELHSLYGLPADGLDKVVTVHGTTYVILGLMPRRDKFPILVKKQSTGKEFCLRTEDIKRALNV
jgi:hypothetical protein